MYVGKECVYALHMKEHVHTCNCLTKVGRGVCINLYSIKQEHIQQNWEKKMGHILTMNQFNAKDK